MNSASLQYDGVAVDSIILVTPEITGRFLCTLETPLPDDYSVEWLVDGVGVEWDEEDDDGVNTLSVTVDLPFRCEVFTRVVCEHGFFVESQRISVIHE